MINELHVRQKILIGYYWNSNIKYNYSNTCNCLCIEYPLRRFWNSNLNFRIICAKRYEQTRDTFPSKTLDNLILLKQRVHYTKIKIEINAWNMIGYNESFNIQYHLFNRKAFWIFPHGFKKSYIFILSNQELTNIYFIYKIIHSIRLAANQYISKIRQTLLKRKLIQSILFHPIFSHLGVHIFSKYVFSYTPNTDHVYMAFSYNMYV